MYEINQNIVPFEDNWTIREVDCFTKPHAILLESISKGTYDTYNFLIGLNKSYGVCHALYENQDWSFGIYEYVVKELGALYHRHYCEDTSELRGSLKECFIQKKGVLVPVDLYYISHAWAYKRTHAFHLFLVIGFDEERDVYVVIDNLQNTKESIPEYENVSGEFSYFQITGDVLVKAWMGLENLPFTYYNHRFFTITHSNSEIKAYGETDLLKRFTEVFRQDFKQDRFREMYCINNMIEYFKDKRECVEKEILHFRLGVIFGNKEGILKQIYVLVLKVKQVPDCKELQNQMDDIIRHWRTIEKVFYFHLMKGDLNDIHQLDKYFDAVYKKERKLSDYIEKIINL